MAELDRIRVMIVDDHTVVRSGIRYSLLAYDDLELIGEAGSGKEALELCSQLKPDVILMDMMMPGMDGVATTRALRQRYPQTQVIALTSFQEGTLVQEALQAGAISYLLKDVQMDQLAEAIRSAHGGRSILAPEATQALAAVAAQPSPPGDDLTPREREVLALIVEGKSNLEIGRELGISLSTARFHVSTIIDKLGAANRTQAATLAVKFGLVA
jgi:NarL family two-component system response regulator LiaR